MCSLRLRQNDTRILSKTLKEVHFATVFASNCHVRSTTLVPTQTITWNSAIKLLSDWGQIKAPWSIQVLIELWNGTQKGIFEKCSPATRNKLSSLIDANNVSTQDSPSSVGGPPRSGRYSTVALKWVWFGPRTSMTCPSDPWAKTFWDKGCKQTIDTI